LIAYRGVTASSPEPVMSTSVLSAVSGSRFYGSGIESFGRPLAREDRMLRSTACLELPKSRQRLSGLSGCGR
jgi:hypothetical protein